MRTRTLRPLLLALALLATSVAPGAQEQDEPEGFDPRLKDDGGQSDMVEEMKALFHEIERKLEEIDIELADAGAGEVPLDQVEDAGIDQLLRDSRAKSQEVIQGIERILEIAHQMGGSSGGSMGPMPQDSSQGQSPLDEERDKGPMDREKTPEAQGEEGEDPKPEGEDDQKQEGDSEKDDPGHSQDPGQNRPDDPREDETGPAVPPGQDAEQWGFLPDRVREVFRNQGGDDLPPQYRDWIDAYYRRLATRRR